MQQEVKKKKTFNINSQLFNSYSCRVYFFNVIFFCSFSRLGNIESFSIECRKNQTQSYHNDQLEERKIPLRTNDRQSKTNQTS